MLITLVLGTYMGFFGLLVNWGQTLKTEFSFTKFAFKV